MTDRFTDIRYADHPPRNVLDLELLISTQN